MCKKLIYIAPLVLVLALTSTVEAADPSLVGWWKFDETSGNTAFDSSGNGNDGTFVGNPQWVPGKVGGALEFDGDDYLDCGNGPSLEIRDQITIAFWFQVQAFQNTWEAFFSKGDSAYRVSRGDGNGDGTHLGISGTGAGGGNGWFNGPTIITGGDWHHFAGTYDGTEGRIYIDGILDASSPASGQINIEPENLWIGNNSQNTNRQLHGLMDDVRLYTRALTVEEIREVMKGIPPGSASEPSPAHEATDVPREVTLTWTPGEFAAPTNGHKVYFGESFDDVNDATGGIAQTAADYTPERLDFGTTYYWRIDEVNAPPTSNVEFKGEVWQFTTEPFAYPIDGNNITATASSAYQADVGPENTINGSGLDANDFHSTQDTDMWLSGSEPNGAWIEYELDKVYKLHEMWVWNANGLMESVIGFGLKDVTTDYSTNGTDYTTLGTTHEFARAPGTPGYAHNTTLEYAGSAAKYIRLTANSNWGGIMPQYGLSEIRFFSIPVYAREPGPDSGTADVSIGTLAHPVDVTLSFRAGREADTHDVYLSTDEQAVFDGNAPVTTVAEAGYGPLPLDLGTTYYWRVDEVNIVETPTTWQGDIWSFTTQEYFVVDDFEDYNDYPPNEIWSTWIDGYGVPTNGSTVGYPAPDWNQDEHYVETAIVHSGAQAMPYFYDNSGPANYSEATFTLDSPQDWTVKGIEALSLLFKGRPVGFVEGPSGTCTMSAAGHDIWDDADEFRYAYKQLSGDGSIVAQVLSVEDTHVWSKAGVMIRETLDAGSTFAALYMTSDNGCRFQARLQTDVDAISDSSVTTLADVNTPHWIKLERVGNEFNAYDSNDGFTWTPLAWNPQTISMDANVYIGLALTSHNSGVTCSAEFSDVQTTASGQFTEQAIGVEMPTNDPAQMYVAIASSGGTPAVVYLDDPIATQVNTWTEWSISLQAFAAQGVNLTNVNTFFIGFGDKNNLQPGGSGVVFFDDIRLCRSTAPEP